ncbi:MAG TPA: type VI secretion system protein, partial [Myxococcales bacterium]|nr:type VI secretion system protein [Myxococcales bacterium]
MLVALSAIAAFLPLADHLGYELCELVALCAGMLGAAPGIAAARLESSREDGQAARAVARGVVVAVGALAIPIAIILLNGLRRPVCDPIAGLVLYLALPVPSAVLAAALGVAAGFMAPRRAGWLVAAVFVAALLAAIWPLLRGPQVFAFDHLAGMFPGPLYDEAIRPTRALWIFRGATLLYAGACAGIALLTGKKPRRRAGTVLVAVCGSAALFLSSQAERFHWKASEARLDEALGATLRTDHLVLHFPGEKTEEERRLLAREAEVSWRAVRDFAGLVPEAAPVHVFLYRSPAEKRRLIGAAETSFTKPWLRQIHMNDGPAPQPILRHELAHAAFADIAPGPFGVPGGVLPR